MALINCPECGAEISEKAMSCPKCGHPMKAMDDLTGIKRYLWRGFEWKSKTEILGWPLIHIAVGRNKETGKLLVAKGIIAIGQFGIGLITIAQFGIGILFGFGQFVGGLLAVGHRPVCLWQICPRPTRLWRTRLVHQGKRPPGDRILQEPLALCEESNSVIGKHLPAGRKYFGLFKLYR